VLPRGLPEPLTFGTCLCRVRCSWLQPTIPIIEVKCCKNMLCIANTEIQIPSVKRKNKVQVTGKMLIHLYSFITLNCKHRSQVSVFKEGEYHSYFSFRADPSAG